MQVLGHVRNPKVHPLGGSVLGLERDFLVSEISTLDRSEACVLGHISVLMFMIFFIIDALR